MRVAVNASSDGAGSARPGLESGQTVAHQPTHQAVDRDCRIGAHAVRIEAFDMPASLTDDKAAHARIRDQHVRAAAKDRDRHRVRRCKTQDVNGFIRRSRLDKEIGRPAHFEGRERTERDVAADALVSKSSDERDMEAGKISIPFRRHARTSARIAFSPASSAV